MAIAIGWRGIPVIRGFEGCPHSQGEFERCDHRQRGLRGVAIAWGVEGLSITRGLEGCDCSQGDLVVCP